MIRSIRIGTVEKSRERDTTKGRAGILPAIGENPPALVLSGKMPDLPTKR